MSKKTNIISLVFAVLFSLFFGGSYLSDTLGLRQQASQTSGFLTIKELYDTRTSGVMVRFDGVISKILPDDNKGSRHQRFIVRVGDQHTVLVAHNIDLAPRVPISRDKKISIYGQYEWNNKGGVVHWTHHDPDGSHEEGWIRYQGVSYQ